MVSKPNPRAVRWLKDELPSLVSAGAISQENARAIERYYESRARGSRNFGFVLLAIVGSALVAAGVILLIAHNWDELSRPVRSVVAFLPLLAAQGLSAFVLWQRSESQPWRESAAIFNVAGIGTAISLVSQTYQITGSFTNFILVWMLLSLPLVYLMRTTLGAIAYLIGAGVWVFNRELGRAATGPVTFWFLLLLVLPYLVIVYRRDRMSREMAGLAIVLAVVAAIGLGFTAEYAKANLGILAFAGFFAAVYISGTEFFRAQSSDRLHPVALLGAISLGVMTIVLTFEEIWRHRGAQLWPADGARQVAAAIELVFPLFALVLLIWSFLRRRVHFSVLAAAFPIAAGLGWLVANLCSAGERSWESTRCDAAAALLLDVYALALGVELIARGMRAESVTRANFGLLIIAALALARFFDSDLSFVARAIGFIVIGLGFLFANLILFRKRAAA